jgi:hypothetical protein
MARIDGAGQAVFAKIHHQGSGADSLETDIGLGADVVVVAGRRVIGISAALAFHAEVVCAGVAIIAIQIPASGQAEAQETGITNGAGVAVLARGCVVWIYAAHTCLAHVVGTDVAVIANQGIEAGGAIAVVADVAHSAGIPVVAEVHVGYVNARYLAVRHTTAVRAGVTVVAIQK